MTLYQANGGEVLDAEDRPFLNAAVLTEVMTYYQQGEEIGVTPYLLTQFQSYEQVWENFLEDRADMVVTWSSHFLSGDGENESLLDSGIAPIPTPNSESYSLATGWVWAMATPEDGPQELSVELAEFLTDSSFLADWTEAAGFIPPRPSALDSWPDEPSREVLAQIARSARLLPSMDILISLGPPLQEATVEVLKRQDDPVTAAQAAAASLTEP
jgi:ABC-type glycerol-3-phosphate transport system substrate-binding protein